MFHNSVNSCTSSGSESSDTESDGSNSDSSMNSKNPVVTQAMIHSPPKNYNLDSPVDIYENILGISPNAVKSQGPPLLDDIALRYANYISDGLEKELKASLMEKWKIPENCLFLTPPKANPEILALMNTSELRKDNFLVAIQELLSKGISALGGYLSKAVKEDPNNTDLEMLVNSGQILCEVQRTLTSHRRFRLNYLLSSQIQQMAQKTKADEYLYGADFGEKWKALKAAESIGKELRAPLQTSLNSRVPSNKVRLRMSLQKKKERGRQYTKRRKYDQKDRKWDNQKRRQ